MKRIFRRRPSAATIIASVALFASLGGSAYAAGQIHGWDVAPRTLTWHNIARHSIGPDIVTRLTGHDVRKASMGGWQVDESTLAKVPAAAKADDATTLAGKAATDYMPNGTIVRLGLVKLTNGQTKDLVKSGPLTLTARCTINSGGNDTARIFAATTEANTLLFGADKTAALAPTTPEASARVAEASGTTATALDDTRTFELTSPSGTSLHGELTAAANTLNGANACQYTGYVVIG